MRRIEVASYWVRPAYGISGLAKGYQHSFGEMDAFFVTLGDLVPRRAVPRTRMINEGRFDGICYDDKAVFWHPGALLAFPLSIPRKVGRRDLSSDYPVCPDLLLSDRDRLRLPVVQRSQHPNPRVHYEVTILRSVYQTSPWLVASGALQLLALAIEGMYS